MLVVTIVFSMYILTSWKDTTNYEVPGGLLRELIVSSVVLPNASTVPVSKASLWMCCSSAKCECMLRLQLPDEAGVLNPPRHRQTLASTGVE
jgi:Flp pilus assembly protein protease CpaA